MRAWICGEGDLEQILRGILVNGSSRLSRPGGPNPALLSLGRSPSLLQRFLQGLAGVLDVEAE